jgi:hypothetical protein
VTVYNMYTYYLGTVYVLLNLVVLNLVENESSNLGPDPFLSLGPGTRNFTIVKAYLVIFYNSKLRILITISRVQRSSQLLAAF